MAEEQDVLAKQAALIAAAPLLIYGLALTAMFLVAVPADRLVVGGPTPWQELYRTLAWLNAGLLVGGAGAAVLIVGGLVAAARRIPARGHSWVGAGLAMTLVALNTLADEREYLISPVVDGAILVALLVAGLVGLVVAVLRGRRESGLLSIGLSGTLALSLCFWVSAGPFLRFDLALLAGPVGFLLGWLTYLYARGNRAVSLAAFGAVGLVELSLFGMAAWVWWNWSLVHGSLVLWSLPVALMGLLLVGPLAGLLRQPLQRVFSRGGGAV
jgi:hypothetical protein